MSRCELCGAEMECYQGVALYCPDCTSYTVLDPDPDPEWFEVAGGPPTNADGPPPAA